MPRGIARTDEFRIDGEGAEVRGCVVHTPNGQRLELTTAAGRVRLDALVLESLTWQTPEEFGASPSGSAADRPASDAADVERADCVHLTNEYTRVRVCVLIAESTDRSYLAVKSLKLDSEIVLSPPEVADLTASSTQRFSEFLETPYGPDGTH